MRRFNTFICVLSVLIPTQTAFGNEFTFEVPDNDEQCFHEIVEPQKLVKIEYQVNCIKKTEENHMKV